MVPPAPKMKSVVVRDLFPSQSKDGPSVAAKMMFPGPRPILIRDLPKVFLTFISRSIHSTTFRNLLVLDIDANTYIPQFFVDFLTLAWLAFLIPDQTKEPTPSLKELEELSDEDIMEISANQFTPRKRRAVKVKEQLDDRYLCSSKRNAAKHGGYKRPLKTVLEPVPLAMILVETQSLAPTPHLS